MASETRRSIQRMTPALLVVFLVPLGLWLLADRESRRTTPLHPGEVPAASAEQGASAEAPLRAAPATRAQTPRGRSGVPVLHGQLLAADDEQPLAGWPVQALLERDVRAESLTEEDGRFVLPLVEGPGLHLGVPVDRKRAVNPRGGWSGPKCQSGARPYRLRVSVSPVKGFVVAAGSGRCAAGIPLTILHPWGTGATVEAGQDGSFRTEERYLEGWVTIGSADEELAALPPAKHLHLHEDEERLRLEVECGPIYALQLEAPPETGIVELEGWLRPTVPSNWKPTTLARNAVRGRTIRTNLEPPMLWFPPKVLQPSFCDPPIDPERWILEVRSADGAWAGTAPVDVVPGLGEDLVRIELRRTGSLDGYVLNHIHRRWPGATVLLIDPAGPPIRPGTYPSLPASLETSDEHGYWPFRVEGGNEEEERRIRAVLQQATVRAGADRSYRHVSAVAKANKDCLWELTDIPAGHYLLLVLAGNHQHVETVEVVAGERRRIEINLPLRPRRHVGRIHGTVRCEGEAPIELPVVLLTAENTLDPVESWYRRNFAFQQRMVPLELDDGGWRGEFTFSGLPEGRYRVELLHESAFPWNDTACEVFPSEIPVEFVCENGGPWEALQLHVLNRESRELLPNAWMIIDGGALRRPVHRFTPDAGPLSVVLPHGIGFRVRVGAEGYLETVLARSDLREEDGSLVGEALLRRDE